MTIYVRTNNWSKIVSFSTSEKRWTVDAACPTGCYRSKTFQQQCFQRSQTHSYRITSDYGKPKLRLPQLPRSKVVTTTYLNWYGSLVDRNITGFVTLRQEGVISHGATLPTYLSVTAPSARSQLDAASRAAQQKVNLAQVFAERQQLVNMVNSTARRIASAYRSIRDRDIAGAFRSLGISKRPNARLNRLSPAKQWLEIQYGWKPLLSDVYGAVQALEASSGRTFFEVVGRAKDRKRDRVTSLNGGTSVGSYRETEVGCRTYLRYSVSDDVLLQACQVGLNNPLLLAWELLPFSFVADWFLPVGDYISALGTAFSGLSFVDGCTSTKQSRRITHALNVATNLRAASGVRENVEVTWSRAVHNTTPIPLPRFKSPFSTAHALNALALLTVSTKRPLTTFDGRGGRSRY